MTRTSNTAITLTAVVTAIVVAAAVGAGPAAAEVAPGKTVPAPTQPFPTVAATAPSTSTLPPTTSTTSTVPTPTVTISTETIPPGTVQLTDSTRRIRVNVPNTWTDTNTVAGVRDDGHSRPTISAATDANAFRSGWTVPGLWMIAVEPSVDPNLLLDHNFYGGSCRDGGVEAFDNGRLTGFKQRWSSCGGTTTQLLIVAARSTDGSTTMLLQLQSLTPDDPAATLVLDSFGLVPGSSAPAPVEPSRPPTIGAIPDSLLRATAPPDAIALEDQSKRIAITVPGDWIDNDTSTRLNDDYSARPYIIAAPNLDDYDGGWSGSGLVFQAMPYHDPSVLLATRGYVGTCTDAGVQTYDNGAVSGYVQTWTRCGETHTRAIIVAAAPADRSATVLIEVHLPDADNTPLALALSTLKLA